MKHFDAAIRNMILADDMLDANENLHFDDRHRLTLLEVSSVVHALLNISESVRHVGNMVRNNNLTDSNS